MNIALYVQSSYKNYEELCEKLDQEIKKLTNTPVLLIADGKEEGTGKKLAIKYADERGIPVKLFEPEWGKYISVNGKDMGGSISSWEMLKPAEAAICICSGLSTGSDRFIEQAKRLNRNLHIVRINPYSKSVAQKKEEDEQKALAQQAAAQAEQEQLAAQTAMEQPPPGTAAPAEPPAAAPTAAPTATGIDLGAPPAVEGIPIGPEDLAAANAPAGGEQLPADVGQALSSGTTQQVGPTGTPMGAPVQQAATAAQPPQAAPQKPEEQQPPQQ